MKQDPNHPATATESLREQAEARLREQRVAVSRRQSDADNHRPPHELQVHQVELQIQNQALLELREQLERNLEKYVDLYDFAPVGYLTVTGDGTIQEMNLAGAALLGLERARLIDRRFGVFVAAEDLPTFNAFLERVRVGTDSEHCEITLAFEGAPPRHLHLEGIAVISGADRGCHLAALDITERKRAEAAIRDREQSFQRLADELREERDRFAKIVATVPGAICSFRLRPDGNACFPYASPAIEDLYGLRPEELAVSAAPLWAMIHPDDLGHVDASIAASARTMTPWRDEFRVKHPTKGEIWVEGHSMPVREPDGSMIWHGYVQDITERKRAEEALQESAAIYRAIGESIDYGVWICAPDGRNIYASDSFLKLVGLTQEQCSNFGWGEVLHPDDAERTIAAWKECTRIGGMWDIEHRYRRVGRAISRHPRAGRAGEKRAWRDRLLGGHQSGHQSPQTNRKSPAPLARREGNAAARSASPGQEQPRRHHRPVGVAAGGHDGGAAGLPVGGTGQSHPLHGAGPRDALPVQRPESH